MKKIILLLLIATASICLGANYYIDNARPSGGDGRSWATAWNNPASVSNLKPGDVCYISGGSTTKVYNLPNGVSLPAGTSGSPVTLSASNDVGHSGTVVFQGNGSSNSMAFLPANWITINGRAGGTNRFRVQDYWWLMYHPHGQGRTGVTLLGINSRPTLKIYDSMKTEVGWVNFDLTNNATTMEAKVIGVGRADSTGHGNNSIHDCDIPIYYNDSRDGVAQDGIKDIGSCDVYNNRIYGVLTSAPTGGDHMDGMQFSGSYCRIFNNYFENMSNYMVFASLAGGSSCNGLRIYNNVFNYSDPELTKGSTCSVAIGGDRAVTYGDLQIINNTFRGGGRSIGMGNPSSPNSFSSPAHIQNNLYYSAGANDYNYGNLANLTVSNEYRGTTGVAFVDLAKGDFHLLPGSTAVIGKGTSAFAKTIFTTDKDGLARTEPWDIGAYKYGGGVAPSPTPTPAPTATPVPTPTPPPFAVGGRVELTASETNVRSAPVIDPANLLGVQPLGVLGTLVEGPVADANWDWWEVDFDSGVDGWCGANNFVSTTKPPPNPTPTPAPTPTPPGPTPTPPLQIQISDVQGLQEALDGKTDKGHTHTVPETQTK
jgi:hypothetical protein